MCRELIGEEKSLERKTGTRERAQCLAFPSEYQIKNLLEAEFNTIKRWF